MPRGVYVRNAADQIDDSALDPQSAVNTEPLSARGQEVRRERRLRDDGDIDRHYRLKLSIPRDVEEQGKREGKVFRWFLDQPGRLSEAHDTDWDVVPGVSQVSAGSQDTEKLVLHWKYKDWHVSDVRQSEVLLDERDKAMMDGRSSETRQAGDGLVMPKTQQNRISR